MFFGDFILHFSVHNNINFNMKGISENGKNSFF